MSRGPRQAPIDYVFWGQLDEWTPDESAALLAGLDPGTVDDQPASREHAQIRELIGRAVRMGDLLNHTRPAVVLSWAKLKQLAIPETLLSAVEQFGGTVEDFRRRVSELEARAKPTRTESKPMTDAERRVARTMIIAMAVAKYSYRPGHRGTAQAILSDAEKLGLNVEDDSIRSWLAKAAAEVDPEVWQHLANPNSARK